MLIVYQSLESTKTTMDLVSTFISGNANKKLVHDSVQEGTSLEKSRVWDGGEIKFETARLSVPIANKNQCVALWNAVAKLEEGERETMALEMLARIVERIVDNASSCTRPQGNVAPYVRCPDVIVLGEIYASSLVGQVLEPFAAHGSALKYVVVGGINPTGAAFHRFTVLVRTGFDGRTPDPRYHGQVEPLLDVEKAKTNKDEDSKCMVIKVRGWLIAFVHTPNNIANSPERAAEYLHNNAQRFGEGSRLDLVMGDTNQSTSDTVKRYMNDAYNRRRLRAPRKLEQTGGNVGEGVGEEPTPGESWEHSVMPNRKQVIRGYTNYEVQGTNSGYAKHFDIACTPQAHVSLSGLTVHATEDDDLTFKYPTEEEGWAFFFHGLTDKFVEWKGRFYAYTDHNGVIVEILRDKPEHAQRIERERRDVLKDEFRQSKKRRVLQRPPGGEE